MEELKNETVVTDVEETEVIEVNETLGRKNRKTFIGRVVSDKMDKTIVVAIETKVRHPLYGKTMKRTTKYKAHDEKNEATINERVLIMGTRPRSKDKNFRLVKRIEQAK